MSKSKKIKSEKVTAAEPAANAKVDADVKAQTKPQGETGLNAVEEMQLAEFEKHIEQNLGGFQVVGRALKAINDEQLYRAKFKKFDDYCRERWGLSDKYAYRLIEAYACMDTLRKELSPIGDQLLPRNESQVMPLTALEPKKQVEAWQQVLKANEGKSITAEEVEKVVDKLLGRTSKKKTTKPSTSKKVEQKLVKIAKLVTNALKEDSEMTVPKLKQALEKIQKMIDSKK